MFKPYNTLTTAELNIIRKGYMNNNLLNSFRYAGFLQDCKDAKLAGKTTKHLSFIVFSMSVRESHIVRFQNGSGKVVFETEVPKEVIQGLTGGI